MPRATGDPPHRPPSPPRDGGIPPAPIHRAQTAAARRDNAIAKLADVVSEVLIKHYLPRNGERSDGPGEPGIG